MFLEFISIIFLILYLILVDSLHSTSKYPKLHPLHVTALHSVPIKSIFKTILNARFYIIINVYSSYNIQIIPYLPCLNLSYTLSLAKYQTYYNVKTYLFIVYLENITLFLVVSWLMIFHACKLYIVINFRLNNREDMQCLIM